MNSQVFLVPCDPENFERTVVSAVNLTDYSEAPDALAGIETVRLWGARTGTQNESYFEKMESGDLVVFYQDGRYVGTGRIGRTFQDSAEWVSMTLWNDAPSTLIYTIEDFSRIDVPKAAVNRIFDYAEGYNPQGLIRVTDSRVSRRTAVIKRALEKYTAKHS